MTRHLVRAAVVAAIAEVSHRSAEQIADSDDLVDDLGIDSTLAVSLLITIEDHIGVTLPDGCEGQLAGARTVGALTDAVAWVLDPTPDPGPAAPTEPLA